MLTAPDRWEVHSAEKVQVTLDHLSFSIIQRPTSLTAQKMGVGACLWDGALFLAAYMLSLPHYKFTGARCVELGAGVGLVSMALAKLGARVIVTDIKKVIPLLQENLIENNVHTLNSARGWAQAQELEWGKEGWMKKVALMADPPLDYVLAADCCYIDNDGTSPSTPAFVQTCRGLCSAGKTRVLVAFERRSPEVRRCLIEEAKKVFPKVDMIPLNSLPIELRLPYCDLWEFGL